jgi:hypothetical protein
MDQTTDTQPKYEENCVYCTKFLGNLNDFNKKMHLNTCKVRRSIEASSLSIISSNGLSNSPLAVDDCETIGDNCPHCMKSFKDFKSDFNKRIHLRCCRIKKETLEQKNKANFSLNNQTNGDLQNTSIEESNNNSNSCAFCHKDLSKLNDFNRKMHLDNCKIRKSLEGISPSRSSKKANKDPALTQLAQELGDHCVFCSKSFTNLSDFNKKLHFDHCKTKKKQLNTLVDSIKKNIIVRRIQKNISESSILLSNNNNQTLSSISSSLNSQNEIVGLNGHVVFSSPIIVNSNETIEENNISNIDDGNNKNFGDVCPCCYRGLFNLSNFNKKVHIDQCKLKETKKMEKRKLRESKSRTIRKRIKMEENAES